MPTYGISITSIGNVTSLSGTSNTQLQYPYGIFFEQSTNSVLIANSAPNNIVRWILGATQWSIVVGNNSGFGKSSSSIFSYSKDVMLDPMNNIYVVNRSNHRVQFSPVGQSNATAIAGVIGKSGRNATLLKGLNLLALDNQLNLYVVD